MALTLIWGFGITGESVANFLQQQQASFIIFDDNQVSAQKAKIQFGEKLVVSKFPDLDLIEQVIVSPGISCWNYRYQQIARLGIPIKTDVELLLSFYKGKVIAVTGTNGKSTLVAMLDHIAKTLGFKSMAIGNIGKPCLQVDLTCDLVVLELSSFHLAHMQDSTNIDISIMLALTPDHLDWHKSYNHYQFSKQKIKNAKRNYTVINDSIFDAYGNLQVAKYNQQSLIMLIAKALSWHRPDVMQAMSSFKALPHRQQQFNWADRTWVNDSKATNAAATIYALNCFNKASVLILAGLNKGWAYEQITNNLKAIIIVGSTKDWPVNTCDIPVHEVLSVELAINLAYRLTAGGETILFAPGGSSFDHYQNYAARGDDFMEQVKCIS